MANSLKSKELNSSTDELASILANIGNRCTNMPKLQRDGIVEILENLLERMKSNAAYKVDFTDYESEFGEFFLGVV